MRFKDQAIVIRVIDWSETSQIVSLLTREHGKLPGLAKGSKRASPSSVQRYSGGFELLTLGQIVGVSKPTAELATLTEWDLQEPHFHLRRDLEAHRLSLYAADLAGAMLADHDPHPNVFAVMAEFLAALARPAERAAALLVFQWRLFDDCGYRPELERDARDGGELPANGTLWFDPRAGGVVGAAPAGEGPAGPWRVRRETIDVLRNASGMKAPPSDDSLTRANRLLCVYARAILDRELPTMGFVLGNEGR